MLRSVHFLPLQLLMEDMGAAGLLDPGISSSLTATFWQQLCQAGLYKLAADSMTDTAEQLQAAAVFHGASLLHPPDFSVEIRLDSGSVTWRGGELGYAVAAQNSSRSVPGAAGSSTSSSSRSVPGAAGSSTSSSSSSSSRSVPGAAGSSSTSSSSSSRNVPGAAGSSTSSSSANPAAGSTGLNGTTPGGKVVSVTAESMIHFNRRLNSACGLLDLYPKLYTLHIREKARDPRHDFMLHVTPAACHLVAASMQYVATMQRFIQQQQQQQQQQQGPTAPQEPDVVFAALIDRCSWVPLLIMGTVQLTGGAEVMQCFYFLPCMAMALLVQMYASLVQQHMLLPAAQAYTGSSSSSSSSESKTKRSDEKQRSAASNSSSLAGSQGAAAGAAAKQRTAIQAWRGVAGQLGRLPVAHAELAALLSCDLNTIVWAGLTRSRSELPPRAMGVFAQLYGSYLISSKQPLHSPLLDLHQLLPTYCYTGQHISRVGYMTSRLTKL